MGKHKVQQWHIPSSQKDVDDYTVTEYDDGSFACSCNRWIYTKEDCRHIKRARVCKEHPELEKEKLQLINGQVSEVQVKGKKAIIPLSRKPIPYDALMTMMHDLLELGVSMKRIKKFFRGNGVSKIRAYDVYEWASTHNKVKIKPLKVLSSFF